MNRKLQAKPPRKAQNRFVKSLKKTYVRFLKIRGHPHEIALGLALGLFVGMSPTMGLHTAIAVFFAALLKWNKISAAIGVWVTNPFTAPVIYGINYYVGAKLVGLENNFGKVGFEGLSSLYKLIQKTPEIFWALIIGGTVLGLPLAAAGYYFAYSVIKKYQDDIKRKLAISKEKLAHKKELRKKKKLENEAAAQSQSHAGGGNNPGIQEKTAVKSIQK